ncbi:MAG: peptide chain release factor 2 [Candidatus Falkowbacteria bacterium]|nr:peptide chain release factor 2 [Candidatus Falkowbacteria bacterium]
MENLLKKMEELRERFLKTKALLDIDRKAVQERELRLRMSEPDFWDDRESAVKIGREVEELALQTKEWRALEKEIREAEEIMALAEKETLKDPTKSEKEGETGLSADMEKKYLELENKFSQLEFISLFSEKYDHDNALLAIHAGTGGVDAQDWAQMLERLYLRFSERQGWKAEIMDRNYGGEAGIKNVVMRVSGSWVYGYLKSENGSHRLLRNSPYNADGLRQTSYALVEVIPEIKDDGLIVIKEEDVRVDVFRSSGPGGQSVNTTDSAVRLIHIPTGITVACQSERSQHQNKENAFKILKAKLYQRVLEEREAEERKLKGEVQKAAWSSQIRSYCLYGKRYVKDHRTGYETSNIDAVLDGALEPFMEAYLRWLKK